MKVTAEPLVMSDKSNGYIQARHGRWHQATVPEPCFTRDETSACGLTFRPLNVTWNGEQPPTTAAHLCKRCEARS